MQLDDEYLLKQYFIPLHCIVEPLDSIHMQRE